MFFTVLQAFFLSLTHNGAGQAVREVFFQAGGQAQDFIAIHVIHKRNDFFHVRRGAGQRPRFVEYNGIRFSKGFQILAAFDHDTILGGFTHGGNNRQRCRQLDGTRVVYRQGGEGLVPIAGQKPNNPGK